MSIKIVSWNCHMGLKIDKVQKILNDNTFACADIYAIQECEEKNKNFFSARNVSPTYTDEILDEKNRIKIKYNKNGYTEYSYDNGGNLITAYKNGVEIYRRKIYTPAEATAAVSKNKNTFSIRYR